MVLRLDTHGERHPNGDVAAIAQINEGQGSQFPGAFHSS
jgi:hypothetical protein